MRQFQKTHRETDTDREIFERERERFERGFFSYVCQGRRFKFGGSPSSSSSSSFYMWIMVCLSKRKEAERQLDWRGHEALGSYSATTCMFVSVIPLCKRILRVFPKELQQHLLAPPG
jgi:hypothetical protein